MTRIFWRVYSSQKVCSKVKNRSKKVFYYRGRGDEQAGIGWGWLLLVKYKSEQDSSFIFFLCMQTTSMDRLVEERNCHSWSNSVFTFSTTRHVIKSRLFCLRNWRSIRVHKLSWQRYAWYQLYISLLYNFVNYLSRVHRFVYGFTVHSFV